MAVAYSHGAWHIAMAVGVISRCRFETPRGTRLSANASWLLWDFGNASLDLANIPYLGACPPKVHVFLIMRF